MEKQRDHGLTARLRRPRERNLRAEVKWAKSPAFRSSECIVGFSYTLPIRLFGTPASIHSALASDDVAASCLLYRVVSKRYG